MAAERHGAKNEESRRRESDPKHASICTGIDGFAKLLGMGNSGWNPSLEESEAPAGVGRFCLFTPCAG